MNWGDNRADPWNTAHFLDLAEMTAAFGIAYDWLYDSLTTDQRDTVRQAIIDYGLSYGLESYTNSSSTYAWWQNVNGNWNCGEYTLWALIYITDKL
jgi:hypothetical protein